MSEGDLINHELLAVSLVELSVVHLPPAQNHQSFLLEGIQALTLSSSHLNF